MALNKYMHERNIYKHRKPDFQALAVKYDYFREKVMQAASGKTILDFKDPGAMRALSRALLEDDFGLSVELPLDRLIPMVPQRLNYVLWLEDLIGKTDHQIRGIDIGTGASCIFPLLGCRQNGWEFLASELDDQNLYFAQKNVDKNKMQDKITIKKVSEDTILSGLVEEEGSYDFCMCNPPFYTDHLEAQGITSSRSDDRPEPSSMSTASETESIAWGGEVRFVSRMIDESLVMKRKIRVYTSMLGKKMSLSLLKDELVKKQIPKFSTTEFCQGKTMRWGVAWTFDDTVTFPKSAFKSLKNVKPPLVYEVPRTSRVVSDYTVQAFTHFIKLELDTLKIHFYIKHSGKFYTGLILKATENNWSHQRRKRRQQKRRSNPECSQAEAEKMDDGGEVMGEIPDKINTTEGVTPAPDKQPVDEAETSVDRDNENSITDNTENVMDPRTDSKNPTNGNAVDIFDKMPTAPDEASDKVPENSTKVEESKCDSNDVKDSAISDETVSLKTESMDTETDPDDKEGRVESKKRTIDEANEEAENEQNGKKFKLDTESEIKPDTESEIKPDTESEIKLDTESKIEPDTESEIKPDTESKIEPDTESEVKPDTESKIEPDTKPAEKPIDLEAAWIKASTVPPETGGKTGNQNKDGSAVINRSDIVKQFWKEQETNSSKKAIPKSPYQSLEPFKEDEECLLLCKLELRKEEGVVKLIMTHLSGKKESMAQIQQYFKNKITTGVCEYGAG